MKKIFIDADVLLDLLLDREPFSEDTTTLIEKSIETEVKLCSSLLSIANMHYIIGRLENKKKADLKIQKILKIVSIENLGQSVIDKASKSNFKDFEDSIQNFCAVEAGHEIIITRNTKDYKESELSIMTPREYLAKLENE
ncbi:MAG: PIN domain-containing protein [Bacteroidota bacterium]